MTRQEQQKYYARSFSKEHYSQQCMADCMVDGMAISSLFLQRHCKDWQCATNKNPENFLSWMMSCVFFLFFFLFFVFFPCNFHPSHHPSLSRFISFLFYFHLFSHVHVMLCSLFSLQDIVFTCVCVLLRHKNEKCFCFMRCVPFCLCSSISTLQ